MRLELPEPCHENWQQMTPQEKGRLCDKCCKVVVDFTHMPTADVISFINERKSERVCGRFRPDQVTVPPAPQVRRSVTERVMRFFAALVLVFGGALFTGCRHEEKVGKISVQHPPTSQLMPDTPTTKVDTAHVPMPKGEVKCVEPKVGKVKTVQPQIEEEIIQGGVSIMPEDEPQPLMGKPSRPNEH